MMDWLGQDPKHLLQTAQRYLQLEQLIQKNLPVGLQTCKVAHSDQQSLILAVPSAAHATKLRQCIPSLLRVLAQHHWQINEVQIQIQSVLFTGVKPLGETRQEKIGIDAQGIDAFKELEKQLDHGPLAQAVKNLLARHEP